MMNELQYKWIEIQKEALECRNNAHINFNYSRCTNDKDNNSQNIINNMSKWVCGWSDADDTHTEKKWLNFGIVFRGIFLENNKQLCPNTYNALLKLSEVYDISIAGYSWLLPHSHIPPHIDGSAKGVNVLHLGLIVPDHNKCYLIVNNEVVHEENGKLLIFNDNLVHEAYNNSDSDRIILYVKYKDK